MPEVSDRESVRGRARRDRRGQARASGRAGDGPASSPLRVAVLGAGGSARCTPSCSPTRCPGAALAAVHDPDRRAAARVAGAARRGRGRRRRRRAGRDDVDAVAICTSTDTHADLIVAAAEAGKADLLREAGVARPRRGRPRAGRGGARPACRCRSASTGASTRPTRPCTRRWRAARLGEPHIVRISSRDPAPAAARLRAALGRHLPRHDDPRLRHGALRDRAARSSRSTRAAPCASTRRRGGRRPRHGRRHAACTRTAA